MLLSTLLFASLGLQATAMTVELPPTCVSTGKCPTDMGDMINACLAFMVDGDASVETTCKKLCDPALKPAVLTCKDCVLTAEPTLGAMFDTGASMICGKTVNSGAAGASGSSSSSASNSASSTASASGSGTVSSPQSVAANATASAPAVATEKKNGAVANSVAPVVVLLGALAAFAL